MARVICSRQNASDNINGIRFHLLDDGRRISDEIDGDDLELFLSIPGYDLDEEEAEPPAPQPVAPAAPRLTKAQQKAAEKAAEKAAQAKAEAEKPAAAPQPDPVKADDAGDADTTTDKPEDDTVF